MTFEKEKGYLQRESFGDITKHPNREQLEKSLILGARTARVAVCSMPCFPMGSPIFTGPQFLVKTSFNSGSGLGSARCVHEYGSLVGSQTRVRSMW